MKELFSLGKLYPSDFLKPGEQPRCEPVEMKLISTDFGAVRLEKTAPAAAMYGRYWYRSGINYTMRNELEKIVDSIFQVFSDSMGTNDVWLDIACNDGTLLSYVKSMITVGIDPADDTFKKEAEKYGQIIQNYFSANAYFQAQKAPAKVITSIAMFYDLEEPEKFIQDIDKVLDKNGLWVMQMSYSPLMIEQMAFDNICHEHIYYYSLFNIKYLLEANGFKIMDCGLNDVNGGSFRLYIMKQDADHTKFGTQPYRDVCNFRVKSMLAYESTLNLSDPATWQRFFWQILELKKQVLNFILGAKAEGKKIWGYGASTKGNTMLQYFGLDNTIIDGIADRSEKKWGLRTAGTNIPVYSEADMRAAKPDYLLMLPWHFIHEFIDREKAYLASGGKFIVPCPEFKIIGKSN